MCANKARVSGVIGLGFVCGRRPHTELNRKTERSHRKVAANMGIWIVESDIGSPPDRAASPGPTHEELAPEPGPALGPRR